MSQRKAKEATGHRSLFFRLIGYVYGTIEDKIVFAGRELMLWTEEL